MEFVITDVKDDLAGRLHDGMVGSLRENQSGGGSSRVRTGTTYFVELDRSAKGVFYLSKPLLFALHRGTEGSRVNDMGKVIVQGFREDVYAPFHASSIDFVDEPELRGR